MSFFLCTFACENFTRSMKKQELHKLIKLAEGGNIIAQSNLGCHYIINSDDDDEAKCAEGVAWLQKSADGGFPPALYHLGLCYLQGSGVKADYYKAYDLFDEATDWPDPIPEDWNVTEEEARSAKGLAYLNKSVTAMLLSYSSSILDMVRAADLGEEHAIAYLATMMSSDGQSLNTDYLTKAYEVNPVLAARTEGVFLYNNGHKEQGIAKLLEAAKGGDMIAADVVIEDYFANLRIQTKEDVLLMEELLPIASIKTAERLMKLLYSFYSNGIIVEKDIEKALNIIVSMIDRHSKVAVVYYAFLCIILRLYEIPEHLELLHEAWKFIELHLDSKEFMTENSDLCMVFFYLANAFQNGKYGFEKNEQTALKLYKLALEGVEKTSTTMQMEQAKNFYNKYTNYNQKFMTKFGMRLIMRRSKRNIKQLKKQIHGKTK